VKKPTKITPQEAIKIMDILLEDHFAEEPLMEEDDDRVDLFCDGFNEGLKQIKSYYEGRVCEWKYKGSYTTDDSYTTYNYDSDCGSYSLSEIRLPKFCESCGFKIKGLK